MKHYYYLAVLCLGFLCIAEYATAQDPEALCGSDYWRVQSLQDPVFYQKNQDLEKRILQVFQEKKTTTGQPEQPKVIPVVVHIIHDGGAENISDEQVQQAIAWLNQALANQGSFNQGSGADCGIQLCLAQRTPDEKETNGITRDQHSLTDMNMETQDIPLKNLNRWQTTDYLNIWLVRSICSDNYGCEVYGYTNHPFAHGSIIDGIVIEAGYVTEIEKVGGLAHEMGHYLGLFHTFEGGCNNNNCLLDGDRICDTPPDQSTASIPCGNTMNSCNTDAQSGPFTSDQPDMSWNFMDYGRLACFHDFTHDQAVRMNASLNSIRSSLLDSKGCLPPCTGKVDVTICADGKFKYHGTWIPADTVAIFHLKGVHACDSVVTVTVRSFPSIEVSLPVDTTITIGDTVLLNAVIAGVEPLKFKWSPTKGLDCTDCLNPNAYPLKTITYSLTANDRFGCTASKSTSIEVKNECNIQIPDAFTPNGDGANDIFRPIVDPCIQTVLRWKILNRWGETVFEQLNYAANDPNLGWDGNWNGVPHPADVLIWLADFEIFDGRKVEKVGELNLIR